MKYLVRQVFSLCALTLLLSLPSTLSADVSFRLTLTHGYDFYYASTTLTVSNPAPVTYHRVESPGGQIWRNAGSTNNSNPFFLTNNLSALLEICTNGLWKLYLNKEDASEELYLFTVAMTNMTTNVFGDIEIIFPMDGSSGITSLPDFHWTGPTNLPWLTVSASDDAYAGPYYSDFLSSTETNWTPSGPLLPGPNTFYVNYTDTSHAGINMTTPTNAFGDPLPGWTYGRTLNTYAYSFFDVVASGSGGATLFGHYRFDDNFYLELDSSGNGNDAAGTFYPGGGSQFPQYTPFGVDGGAIEFDGFNAMYWETNLTSALAGSYTISLWIETVQSYGFDTDDGYDGAAIFAGDSFYGEFPVPMALTGDKLAFYTANPDDTLHSSSSINSGFFTHVVVTRDATTGAKKVYVDGVLEASNMAGTSPGIDSEEVYLGYSYFSDQGIEGVVDDLQIYSGALNGTQVDYLYNNPGMTAPDLANPLADAVDAPGLTWTTGGEMEWFAQSDFTYDGDDAARSGAIGDNEESWIETTVQGPGYLRFQWGVDSDDFSYDRLELTIDGFYENDISGLGNYWSYEEVYVGPGTSTIRWTYIKDGSGSDGEDAAWLDQVQFVPEIEVSLNLTIERSQANGQSHFLVFPYLSYVAPSAITTHEVESPNGHFSGDTSGSSSVQFDTFQEIVDECEAGDWTLYINRNDPSEQQYTFTVTFTTLSSNDLPIVTILSPTNDATGIATNHTFMWAGPTDWDSLYLNSYLANGGGTSGGFTSLPPATVSSMAPNALATGSNIVYVSYRLNGSTGVELSAPMDASFNPLYSWAYDLALSTRTSTQFGVEAGAPAAPVTILNPQRSGADFVFSMLTQAGKSHVVQCRTNMTTAPWLDVTNFIGDGNLKLLQLPLGTNTESYYRMKTQ